MLGDRLEVAGNAFRFDVNNHGLKGNLAGCKFALLEFDRRMEIRVYDACQADPNSIL